MPVRLLAGAEVEHGTDKVVGQVVGGDDDGAFGREKRAGGKEFGQHLAAVGGIEVLGSEVDLGAVDLDSYIVAGSTDHIIPWENAYRSTQLLGGTPRFVLSTSGHIQALVNPPAEASRASYRIADEHPETPDAWAQQAAPAQQAAAAPG